MRYTVYSPEIPVRYREDISKGKAVKLFALQAIKNGLNPVALPSAELSRISLNLTDDEEVLFNHGVQRSIQVGLNYPNGKLIGAYCYAQIQELIKKEQSETKPEQSILRPDQEKYYKAISASMAKGGIVLAEGGTGLGKSRVLAMLARDAVKNGDGPVCIAAPTISVLRHLYDELKLVPDTEGLQVGILLGKSQFLNPDRLHLILGDPESVEKIARYDDLMEWCKQGCPPLQETGSDVLDEICLGIRYLYDDLMFLAPELAGTVGLTLLDSANSDNEDENAALEVYREMFAASKEVGITLCSHAMLAIHMNFLNFNNNSVGILPPFKTLLIDEAHILEMTVSNINTYGLSIFSLRATLRQTNFGSAQARKEALKYCELLIGNHKQENVFLTRRDLNDSGNGSIFSDTLKLLEGLEQSIRQMFGRKKLSTFVPESFSQQIIKESLYTLKRINSKEYPVNIRTSPIKCYPNFTVGPASVKHLFETLWSKVKAAALVSATLTLPGIDGIPNANHIKKILNIPAPRLNLTEPVRQKWLYSPVTLHVPGKNELEQFIPATITADELKGKEVDSETQEKFNIWFDAVTRKIDKISMGAKGGTIILLTSYALLDKFKEAGSYSRFSNRMMFHDRGIAFQQQKMNFINQSLQNKRPVWFALGNAWTGLDISGHQYDLPAKEDNLLTDLIIPRVPFGLNTSMTGLSRNNFQVNEAGKLTVFPTSGRNDAAFLFKQGIGRLVRREGVPAKNLWVLDARIWLKDRKMYGVFQQILAPYKIAE